MQKIILYEVFRYGVGSGCNLSSLRSQIRLLFYWVRLYSRSSSNSAIVTGHTVLLCVS